MKHETIFMDHKTQVTIYSKLVYLNANMITEQTTVWDFLEGIQLYLI